MRAVLLFPLLLLSFVCSAQDLRPSAVEDALRTSHDQELRNLLTELDVPGKIVDYYSAGDIVGFKWIHIGTTAEGTLHVLALPCSSILGAPILLLEHSKGLWHLRDQDGMDCHYDDSANLEPVSLTSGRNLDLLLHHDCRDRGTDYAEQHMRLLRIVGTHFHTVLETQDVVHAYPAGSNGSGSFEESAFLPTSAHTLEQTRTSTTYKNDNQPDFADATIQRRSYVWNGSRFIASPWQRLRSGQHRSTVR